MDTNDEGLNDRDELLNELRIIFRYEELLIKNGWYSESDFRKAVESIIKDYLLLLLK
ncbi:hypothetical protein [uncultured Duncaniella sp.]|uniref:hypothetical protein n=1 Tax=uncultured Duncaniella sp. TaxID=2768039 RepID=UPI002617E855|nr:hypothetical protein [uncultured Duncaniella sp.]